MHKEFSRRTERTKRLDTRVQKRGKKRRKIKRRRAVCDEKREVLPIGPNFYGWSPLMKQPRGFSRSFSVATFLLSDHT
jgi:hypothetical protein